ncbi:hypothetical protein GCM10012275_19350 [Longimycelium tulufanense]|uniref:Uncharacterized protein n=1 Tax=Longimycelium tulufanense TaxID=907463 RepID=A0A8J3CA30_9PSEU|nr:hypothetical protein GCM10012275_19350 [Longimycelium tulufanense]
MRDPQTPLEDLESLRRAMYAEVERDGLTVIGTAGTPVAHPLLRFVLDAEKMLRPFAATSETPEHDPADEFFE